MAERPAVAGWVHATAARNPSAQGLRSCAAADPARRWLHPMGQPRDARAQPLKREASLVTGGGTTLQEGMWQDTMQSLTTLSYHSLAYCTDGYGDRLCDKALCSLSLPSHTTPSPTVLTATGIVFFSLNCCINSSCVNGKFPALL